MFTPVPPVETASTCWASRPQALLATVPALALPDRHRGLQPVDAVPGGAERLVAVRRAVATTTASLRSGPRRPDGPWRCADLGPSHPDLGRHRVKGRDDLLGIGLVAERRRRRRARGHGPEPFPEKARWHRSRAGRPSDRSRRREGRIPTRPASRPRAAEQRAVRAFVRRAPSHRREDRPGTPTDSPSSSGRRCIRRIHHPDLPPFGTACRPGRRPDGSRHAAGRRVPRPWPNGFSVMSDRCRFRPTARTTVRRPARAIRRTAPGVIRARSPTSPRGTGRRRSGLLAGGLVIAGVGLLVVGFLLGNRRPRRHGRRHLVVERFAAGPSSLARLTIVDERTSHAATGIVLDDTGHIVTRARSVEGASEIWVSCGSRPAVSATVLANDPVSDVAVLSSESGGGRPPSGDEPRIGIPVVAVQNHAAKAAGRRPAGESGRPGSTSCGPTA